MADELPFIDEFDAMVNAPAADVFTAVGRHLGGSFDGRVARAMARILGCAQQGGSYTVPPAVGQETNGFRVAEVVEPKKLVLEGRHRFAMYRLSFLVQALPEGRVMLRARTEALFPGISGAIYRALVIGTGGHEMVVRRMLASIARQAESLRG